MKTARPGFTLLEVLLVMVIIAVMIGLATPSIEAMYADARVKAGSDHLRSRFAETRSHAIEEGRVYRFAVKPGQSGYKFAPDSTAHWDATGTNNSQQTDDDAGTAATVVEDVMPNNITIDLGNNQAPATDSKGYTTILRFFPDGSCDNDTTITLRLDDARPIDVSVRALTASVTAKYQSGSQ
ncbi:MAG: Tfp pilus assembly protein FimT/FimU [Gemmataceae bacterium]